VVHLRVDVAEISKQITAGRAIGWAHDSIVFINPNCSRHVNDAIEVGNDVIFIDENWHCQLLFGCPLAHCNFVSVECHGDNREAGVL
jgi:hypothetical protein